MGLFKSKVEKEQERKMKVKRAIREFQKRIEKLKAAEAKYIKLAEIAVRENIPQMLDGVKKGIQMTRTEIKRTYSMLIQTELISQMKEMTDSTGDFFETVRMVSQAVEGVSAADMRKLTKDLNVAMEKIGETSEVLDEVMTETSEAVGEFTDDHGLESDTVVSEAIYSQLGLDKPTDAAADGSDFNLEELKKKFLKN